MDDCTFNGTLTEYLDYMDKVDPFGKKGSKKNSFNEHSPYAHSTQDKQHECAKILGSCGMENPD